MPELKYGFLEVPFMLCLIFHLYNYCDADPNGTFLRPCKKTVVYSQRCSLKQNAVRPDLVEGLYARDQWFDRLTTNG